MAKTTDNPKKPGRGKPVFIPNSLHQTLKVMAAKEGVTLTALIHTILNKAMANRKVA